MLGACSNPWKVIEVQSEIRNMKEKDNVELNSSIKIDFG
jgi:hypothetical protein